MRHAVRAIIIHDNKLLVMHRNKFGKIYNTLPGGGIELTEDPEQALYRELLEETSIEIKNPKLVFVEEAGPPYGTQLVYLCEYMGGTPALNPQSEEAAINKLGQNLYEPGWIPLSDLDKTPFLSDKLQNALLKGVAEGFPELPVQI